MAVLKPWEQVAASQAASTEEPKLKPWEQVATGQNPVEEETSFVKGFVEAPSLEGNIADIITAYTGMGFDVNYRDEDGYGLGFTSLDEKYGSGFADASVDERREMIKKQRARQLQEEYGDVEGSTFGNILGSLTSPTTALPVGATYKGMATIGGAIGGSFSIADQLAQKGEVDPLEAGAHTLAGAVLAPVGGYAFTKVAQGIKAVTPTKIAVKSANKSLDDFDTLVSHNVANGVDLDSARISSMQRLKLEPSDIENAYSLTNRKPMEFTKETAANMVDDVEKASAGARFIESISSRIKEASPKVWNVLVDYERKLVRETAARKKVGEPFLRELNKYSRKTKSAINNRLVNGDYDGAKKLLTKGGSKELDNLKKMLIQDGIKLKSIVKGKFKPNKDYFPRRVKDIEGLRKELGRSDPNAAGILSKALEKARVAADLKYVTDLPEETVTKIAAQVFNTPLEKVVGGAKAARSVTEVPENLMKYYDDAADSLLSYVESTTRTFEKSDLLGASDLLKAGTEDTSSLLYKTLGDEAARGRMSAKQQSEVRDLIRARFTTGEQAMNSTYSFIKDLGYMATLGQLRSAATQIKDLGTSAYLHGVMPTIKGALNLKSDRLEKTGLVDIISSEMSTSKGTTKILNGVLKLSLFKAVDRFGKRTLLEASTIKGKALASSPKGIEKLRKKYGEAYGDDFDSLVLGLKNGVDDDLTDLYRFHEISETQPVSMLELPEMYLKHPDGRILYALKSFALKQLTLLHNDVVKEARSGNKLGATKNALKYAAFVGIAGGTVDEAKDVMSGESFNVEDIPDNVLANIVGLFFVNKYSIGDIKKGDFSSFAGGLVTPPLSIPEAAIKDIVRWNKGVPLDETLAPVNLLKVMPVVGNVIYNWVLGGKEKANEKNEKERIKKITGM